MQILVNHLTRMQPGCICVAGIESNTGLHIRPVEKRQLRSELLSSHGGPLHLGARIEFPHSRFAGQMPEIEDRLVRFADCRQLEPADRAELMKRCQRAAVESLTELFGKELRRLQDRAIVLPERGGQRSLGCWSTRANELSLDAGRGRLRISVNFEGRAIRVPLTDIRLYHSDQHIPEPQRVAYVQQRLAETSEHLFTVGISRPFRRQSSEPAYHWFQINNIILPWVGSELRAESEG